MGIGALRSSLHVIHGGPSSRQRGGPSGIKEQQLVQPEGQRTWSADFMYGNHAATPIQEAQRKGSCWPARRKREAPRQERYAAREVQCALQANLLLPQAAGGRQQAAGSRARACSASGRLHMSGATAGCARTGNGRAGEGEAAEAHVQDLRTQGAGKLWRSERGGAPTSRSG